VITYTTAKTHEELEGILALQKANLSRALTENEKAEQGFVTVVHTFQQLQMMNEIAPHIIAKQHNLVIGYILAMTPASRTELPVLEPMFIMFDKIEVNGKPISAYQYMVVGQACVDKMFRGQGVLDGCYQAHKDLYRLKYEFAITEIATKNTRSMQAHQRIGFHPIYTYKTQQGEGWSIVIWEW
jgi:hypothetical protein